MSANGKGGRHFFQEYHESVGPDMGPNSLQRILADDTRRWKVKSCFMWNNGKGERHYFQEYRESVGPDMGPSCLQRLLADHNSRQRVH